MASSDFEELALPLLDALFNFACWLAGDRSEAEDLVQETYVKALRGFSAFQQGTNFKAWIFQILRNTFLTSRTGLAARMTVSLDEEEEALTPAAAVEHETPETLLLTQIDVQLVQGAIAALPVQHREVVLLADLEELKYAEIAETLGIPIGTVMSRLARARHALRRSLTEQAARNRSPR